MQTKYYRQTQHLKICHPLLKCCVCWTNIQVLWLTVTLHLYLINFKFSPSVEVFVFIHEFAVSYLNLLSHISICCFISQLYAWFALDFTNYNLVTLIINGNSRSVK